MQNLNRSTEMVLKRFLSCILFALLMTIALGIPVINMIPFLLGLPLHLIWPELGTTGKLVEYGFMWIIIKANWLWPVYFTYFFILTFIPSIMFGANKKDKG